MPVHTYPHIGVGAVILDEQQRILLILRKRHPEANTWSIPGGKVELYEPLEDAVVREIAEEVGVRVQVQRLLCMAETIDPAQGEHWISSIYTTTVIEGKPENREPDAIAEVRWFSLEELPENLSVFTLPAIRALRG